MPDDEAPLDKKDITAEITGKVFDFDNMDEEPQEEPETAEGSEEKPEGINPVVGIIDAMIKSSPKMLEKHGYPAPNLEIWDDWGKENLSKAFNEYMPEGAGNAISSPAFCGILGLGALVFSFLPVILHFIDKKEEKKQKAIAEKQAEQKAIKEAEKAAEHIDEYETPKAPTGIISTAPMSMGTMTAMEKFRASGENAKLAGF